MEDISDLEFIHSVIGNVGIGPEDLALLFSVVERQKTFQKGRFVGMSILLHGPRGVGKTFTIGMEICIFSLL